jgi:hypothetical protein
MRRQSVQRLIRYFGMAGQTSLRDSAFRGLPFAWETSPIRVALSLRKFPGQYQLRMGEPGRGFEFSPGLRSPNIRLSFE